MNILSITSLNKKHMAQRGSVRRKVKTRVRSRTHLPANIPMQHAIRSHSLACPLRLVFFIASSMNFSPNEMAKIAKKPKMASFYDAL